MADDERMKSDHIYLELLDMMKSQGAKKQSYLSPDRSNAKL